MKQEPKPVFLEPKPLPYLQQLNNNNSSSVLDNNNVAVNNILNVDNSNNSNNGNLVNLTSVEKQEPLDTKDPLIDLAASNPKEAEARTTSPASQNSGNGEVPSNSYYSH